jgi:hypothetical protein
MMGARFARPAASLFGLDLLAAAIEQGAARVDVTYHPILGYPERIALDYDAVMADDEFGYTLTAFQPR